MDVHTYTHTHERVPTHTHIHTHAHAVTISALKLITNGIHVLTCTVVCLLDQSATDNASS